MQATHESLNFYSFFTKYSVMEDYGFASGLTTRFFRKILPKVPNQTTIEYALIQSDDAIEQILDSLNFESINDGKISKELNLSIKALGTKVVAFGIDHDIKANFDVLNIDLSPFEVLFKQLNNLQESSKESISELTATLMEAKTLIILLRKNKRIIGTNLHLTITTRRILEYMNRMKELLLLKANIDSRSHWEDLFVKYVDYSKNKNSLRRFIVRHIDLVALETVEHTSNKGGSYIAESKSEYWSFFRKALLGGSIISIFAFFKIGIDYMSLDSLPRAFFYSLNYAACFVLVKQFGGIIATKQPAVTASTLAKGIDGNDNLEIDSIQDITLLLKKVSRSQFISIVGNFLMAIIFAFLIAGAFKLFGFDLALNTIDSKYLIKNTLPSYSLVFFAAIAGVFLALAGLISGYIDNKVVASKIAYRIANGKRFFSSRRLANLIEKKSGALIGNVILGFFLGSTFLLSFLFPFSVDIRHIAFSSANIGYSILVDDLSYQVMLLAMSGALLIGFVNFIVSFSITLFLALKSRGASFRILPLLFKNVFIDFIKSPLSYFFVTKNT